jgi:hypothetical protein
MQVTEGVCQVLGEKPKLAMPKPARTRKRWIPIHGVHARLLLTKCSSVTMASIRHRMQQQQPRQLSNLNATIRLDCDGKLFRTRRSDGAVSSLLRSDTLMLAKDTDGRLTTFASVSSSTAEGRWKSRQSESPRTRARRASRLREPGKRPTSAHKQIWQQPQQRQE